MPARSSAAASAGGASTGTTVRRGGKRGRGRRRRGSRCGRERRDGRKCWSHKTRSHTSTHASHILLYVCTLPRVWGVPKSTRNSKHVHRVARNSEVCVAATAARASLKWHGKPEGADWEAFGALGGAYLCDLIAPSIDTPLMSARGGLLRCREAFRSDSAGHPSWRRLSTSVQLPHTTDAT